VKKSTLSELAPIRTMCTKMRTRGTSTARVKAARSRVIAALRAWRRVR
jgi:hypothetical protein